MESRLMSLPIELRSQIIETVLLSPSRSKDPSNDHYDFDEPRQLLHDVTYKVPSSADSIYHQQTCTYTITPLLLACHQLHAETLSAFSRVRPRLQYTLDILLVESKGLHLTWTQLPTVTPFLPTLTLSLRTSAPSISGIGLAGHFDFSKGYPAYVRGPSHLTYSIVERILHVGPVGKRARVAQDAGQAGGLGGQGRFAIGRLVVDVVRPRGMADGSVDGSLHSGMLAVFMRDWFGGLVGLEESCGYMGMLLYERVGSIVVQDEEEEQVWDLGELLREKEGPRWFAGGDTPFSAWQEETLRLREQLGLT